MYRVSAIIDGVYYSWRCKTEEGAKSLKARLEDRAESKGKLPPDVVIKECV